MDPNYLPIRSYAEEIVTAVKDNPIIVLIGETGSGKTTQLPQILLDAGFARDGKRIAVTQPRRVGAVTVAHRVAEERGCVVGEDVGYSVRFEDRSSSRTKIKYLTDGTLLRECLDDPFLSRYSVVILDEAHERSLDTDILFGVLKRVMDRRFHVKPAPDATDSLKIVVTSATLDDEKISAYFHDCPVVRVPGRCFPVDVVYATEDHVSKDYAAAAVDTALQIHVAQPPGDILIFLTGQAEIESSCQNLRKSIATLPAGTAGPLLVLPLYASQSPEQQLQVFAPPPAPDVRRCIIATNVAETSLTVHGVVYVIDTGVVKQKRYVVAAAMDSLEVVPISRVAAAQRAGRAGRTQPGICFRLYTRKFYETSMPDVTVPEIQRSGLASTALYLKSLELEDVDVLNFDFLDPPEDDAMRDALRQLFVLDALTVDGDITGLGREMAALPVDPPVARALLAARQLNCLPQMISVAAMTSAENIFLSARPRKEDTSHRKGSMSGSGPFGPDPNSKLLDLVSEGLGDHVAYLRIWEAWVKSGFSKEFTHDLGLDGRGMKFARDLRRQLAAAVGAALRREEGHQKEEKNEEHKKKSGDREKRGHEEEGGRLDTREDRNIGRRDDRYQESDKRRKRERKGEERERERDDSRRRGDDEDRRESSRRLLSPPTSSSLYTSFSSLSSNTSHSNPDLSEEASGRRASGSTVDALRHALTLGYAARLARRLPRYDAYKPLVSIMGSVGANSSHSSSQSCHTTSRHHAPVILSGGGGGLTGVAQLHPSCCPLTEDADGLPPEFVIYHEMVATSRPFLRRVCVVKDEWVSEVLSKLMNIDVMRLSKSKARSSAVTGRRRAGDNMGGNGGEKNGQERGRRDGKEKGVCVYGEHNSGKDGVKEGEEDKGGGGMRKSNDKAVAEARERYLQRKRAAASIGTGGRR
uniref:RNA helicase n=1 Tax=Polytomella parva TaxID=51329 RepID=A0A7S0USN5_9CHLO|mmetsp:Transcript_20404/g.36629  ORF Transcript_20404/g.36629 Transcript_20404/m.36629 type:complete len:924 (+) Transcript_20404:236-3007(+)